MESLNDTIQLLELMRTDLPKFLEQFGTFEDAVGFSKYRVSDLGFILNKRTCMLVTPRIMKDGHEKVLIVDDDGKRLWYPTRFVVARTFVSNENDYNEVEHIDGDRQNNEASNLCWV